MRALCGNLRVECGSLQTGFSESLRKKRAGLICGRDIPRAAGSVWLQPALPLGLPAALAAPAPSRRLCLQGLLVTEMASVTVQGQPCKGPEAHASRVAQVTGHLPVCVEYSLQDHSGLEPAGPRAGGGGQSRACSQSELELFARDTGSPPTSQVGICAGCRNKDHRPGAYTTHIFSFSVWRLEVYNQREGRAGFS